MYNSQKLETTQMPFNRGTKIFYICAMEYYSAIKNNEFMKFLGNWVELENGIQSEVTKSQKTTNEMHSLLS